jgi:hypothetical protein
MESIETTTSLESSPRSCFVATATEKDLETLGEWGYVFNELYGQELMGFDGSTFKRRLRELMALGLGIVLCAHEGLDNLRGAVAGVYYKDVFSDRPCISEIFWYVLPGSPKGTGTRLLAAFEEWGKTRKAERITMAYMMHNEKGLEEFYLKRGYTPFEKHFFKLL